MIFLDFLGRRFGDARAAIGECRIDLAGCRRKGPPEPVAASDGAGWALGLGALAGLSAGLGATFLADGETKAGAGLLAAGLLAGAGGVAVVVW